MMRVPYDLRHPVTGQTIYYTDQQVTVFENDSFGWIVQDGWVITTCGWSVDQQTYIFSIHINGVDVETGKSPYS